MILKFKRRSIIAQHPPCSPGEGESFEESAPNKNAIRFAAPFTITSAKSQMQTAVSMGRLRVTEAYFILFIHS